MTQYVDGPTGGTPLNAANVNRDFNARPAKWAPNTPYVGGTDLCINPSGDLVSCVTSHTSGATYDATQWALSATYISKGELVLNVKDYGTLGTADDSSVFQRAFNDAGAKRAELICPPGTYIIDNVTVPANVKFRGAGADPYRFGSTGLTLKHKAASTNPCLTLSGNGVTMESVTLDGNSATGDVLYITGGFEDHLRNVRIINGAGIGLNIALCGNSTYDNVYVDNCGSSTLPAVMISSPTQPINTLDFNGLTVERQANMAIQIGRSTDTYAPEFVRFNKLHMESPTDNGGTPNVGPLISIVMGRSISFIDPFIFGGPGALIAHNQATTSSTILGGVQIIGGTLLGNTGANMPPRLVDLVTGNEFTILGTRLDNCTYGAIRAGASYGDQVNAGNGVIYTPRCGATFEDLRTGVPKPGRIPGSIEFGAHISSAASASPTIAAGGNNGTTPPAPSLNPSTDTRGNGFFGSGSGPIAGAQVVVTFAKPYATAPIVLVNPGNAATAALGNLYTAVTTTGFTLYTPNAPAASQGNGTYNFVWTCIG
jgi:hypothetical protein